MSLPKKATEVVDALGLIPHPEGGFFVETYRSGSVPMTTMGQTGFQCKDPESNLVVANGRKANRPDGDERRNALTSITWVPTLESPIVMLAINCSDHVHYYQGGLPFQYFMFDAESGEFKTEILGPDIRNGHKLQIPVRGGLWKCGKILVPEGEPEFDYAAIGEGVAPGFDFHDFTWVTKEDIAAKCTNPEHAELFRSYLHEKATEMETEGSTVQVATEFYDK